MFARSHHSLHRCARVVSIVFVPFALALFPQAAGQQTSTVQLTPLNTSLNLDATPHSMDPLLMTYTWPDFTVANAIVLKFDLSALPAGASVTDATLHLALVQSDTQTGSTYTVSAHKVLNFNPDIARATGYTADGVTAWTPSSCCYDGVPLAQSDISPAYDTQAISKTAGFKTWSLTELAQEWMANPSTNFGVLLNSDASKLADRFRYFASTAHADPALRPFLRVTFAAADATPPSVAITAPASGATVSNTAAVAATATDNVGVADVQFRLDGAPLGNPLTGAPYTVDWDTTTAADGVHTLTAVARDAAGNVATSAGVSVTVANGVVILVPQDTSLNLNAVNYSVSPLLTTYTWPDFKKANAILMTFDLSAIPAGAFVTQASLHLWLLASDTAADPSYAVSAHKVLNKNPVIASATGYTSDGVTAWTPNACCAAGVPLAQADISAAYDQRTIDKAAGFKLWTITAMVQEWLADPGSNIGLLLNSDASKPRDRFRTFASMEHVDPAGRPFLRVTFAPGETTPPAVAITAPSAGATVSGTVAVSANASDNVGVSGVAFKLDGAALGVEDTTSPYSVSWNTTATANGSHTLTAVARDATGNTKTSAGVTVTVSNGAPPPPPGSGIAALYPGDAGIENDPNVVFVERFEEATKTDLFNRWNDVLNGSAMSFSTDVPSGSSGSKSLDIPWTGGGVNDGGHLFKQLSPGGDDVLYVRYYIKYPASGSYDHTGIWMGGNNPSQTWPNPQAGVRPAGNDRFIAGAEQNTMSRFDHYNYWMNMHLSSDGNYWGNLLLNNPSVQAAEGQWTCVEHMVKLNQPTTSFNGEHAIWLNGVKVSHLGQGFPNGSWSGGIFTQQQNGTPFEGFRWRSTSSLNLNWIWLQVYAPDDQAGFTGHMKFDHVVLARSYIGCLASGSPPPPPPPDPTPPSVSISSPSSGAVVSGTVAVSANASDNVGVAGVRFRLDGANLGVEDTTAPYSISWNTTTASSGVHTLTAVARDAAGNTTTSSGVTVTVNNGSSGSAIFESNWDTATGTSSNAVTDGGRWPNYWEFNNGSSVQLLSVVSGGPNGHNALRVQQRGSTFAANLQLDNFLPQSNDYYLRYYMKNDDTSGSGDHVVTVDTFQYSNLTFMRKFGGSSSWDFVMSLYGCGYTYPIGHWGPSITLANGQWYRFEYFVDFVDSTHVQVHPRVYDAAGNLILSDADFRQSDFGQASWNGRSDWTLASYYAAGHRFCVNPGWVNDFGLGNNGQAGAADTGRYWYFSGVQIKTGGWPGP